MFKVSEATAIALHSMIYISKQGGKYVSLKPIAQKFKISEHHLSKVLQRLVKAGFLESAKGPKGGFKASPDKKNATFLEIYEAIEGKTEYYSCLFSSNTSDCPNCIMGDFLKKAGSDFYDFMKNRKISDVR